MRSPILTVMSDAAIKAGKGLLRDFGEVDQLQISRKGTANFVTKTDLRTEKKLIAELKKSRPDFGFLSEEAGEIPGKDFEYRWIIDPLDGTSNFIHAVPYFCTAIALERRVRPGASEIVAGVIYDAIHNELFMAEKGGGAFLNDRRLAASGRNMMDTAMLVTGNPRHNESDAANVEILKRASASTAAIRYTGASALDLAYVAAGRFDAAWFTKLQPWDVAAGMLMVREAGGMVTDFTGGTVEMTSPHILASNQSLHTKMLKLLAG